MKLVFSIIRFLFWSTILIFSLGGVIGFLLVLSVSNELPKLPDDLNRLTSTPQTVIYASTGQALFGLGEKKSVPLSMVSRHFTNAILATEDHLFFEHHGVNKLRILKGLYVTFLKPGRMEGGSTITQQLAKNLFFSFEKSFKRKFQEMLLAFQIEVAHSKEEILEVYINQIHFGAGAQGVERAAQTFFGKSALDLDLAQAALLAGLPKSPTNYNPFHYPRRAIERRNIILERMVNLGLITPEQADEAVKQVPVFSKKRRDSRSGSYFIDAVIRSLIQMYGENVVFHGGLKVYSTFDPRLEDFAKTALKNGLENLDELMGNTGSSDPKFMTQGAIVAIETGSGAIRAMIGGRDYYQSEFNRAIDSYRQAGSGFKPFVYCAGFKMKGLHPANVMIDQNIRIPIPGDEDWEPGNFKKRFRGPMILKMALAQSVNTIAVQMVQLTGPESIIEIAKDCGITSHLNPVYSIALGTSEVSPLEMASAFSVFANLGIRHEPFLIRRVEDHTGEAVFEHIIQDRQVLEPALAYQVVDMMKAVLDYGSGHEVRRVGFNRIAAGKTGTTNDFNDAWFTGFTPNLSTSVWVGFDHKRSLKDINGIGITGGRGAAPIWAAFMEQALKDEPERDFSIPDDIRFELVNSVTGCAPDSENSALNVRVALKTEQNICQDK